MNNHHEQMPVWYKQLGSGQGTDFHFESSLDLIFSPGCFTVEIEHSGKDVGLPIDYCGEEHYFVGNLVVTDSGTAGHKQKNRVTGQMLTITSRKDKETKVFNRTYADGEWSQWRSLAHNGMYDNISTTDELLATVESLVTENTRAKEVEEGVKRAAVDISSLACTAGNENITLTSKSMDGEVIHSVEIPVATTEKAGVISAEDRCAISHIVDKEVVLESQYKYQRIKLDFVIHKGSLIKIEGDFNKIACSTDSSFSDFKYITSEGIADRDTAYISMVGTGIATMRVKGDIFMDIKHNADEIVNNKNALNALKMSECYIFDSNLVAYPARKDGSDMTAGYYKGYEISLEGLYSKGYRFVKCRAASYIQLTSDSDIVPCIIYDKDGIVINAVTEYKSKSTAWYILPITENSKTLRASYGLPETFHGIDFIPYKYELLTDDLVEDIDTLAKRTDDISNKVDIFNSIIEGANEILDVKNITKVSNPAGLDFSTTPPSIKEEIAGYFQGYTVDLTKYRDKYNAVYFRGANFNTSGYIVRGYIVDNEGRVETYVRNTADKSNGWQELPVTHKSATLKATYCIDSRGGEKWTPENGTVKLYRVGITEWVDSIEENVDSLVANVYEFSEKVNQIEQKIDVFLPENMYVLKGRLTQFFFRGFIKAVDPYVYDIKVLCSIGKTYKRYYEIEHNSVGDFPLKIEVRDNNRNVIGIANTIVKIVEPSSISAKNILCCGASGTAPGHWAAELKRMLTDGSDKYSGLNLPMTFVGRKAGSSDDSVQLEATGGWTWNTFINSGTSSVRFNITSLKGNIGVGTKLTFADPEKGTINYIVQEVNVTDGVGNIRCSAISGNVIIPSVSSGTLTGDSISITFENVTEESFVPFFNNDTGEVDFKSYADKYCNSKIDVIITHLGVNSVLWENSKAPVSSIKAFLDGYFKDFPDGKVLISAITFPDYGTNVYANSYSVGNINRYGTLCAFFDYNKALYDISQLDEYKDKVVYCPSNVFFDTDYGYPKTNKDVNSRITSIKESIDTNGVHPIKEGSYLIADSILPTFAKVVL